MTIASIVGRMAKGEIVFMWPKRWRIDVADDTQVHLQPIRFGTEYTAIPDDNKIDDDRDHETTGNEFPPRLLIDIATSRQPVLHGTSDSPATERRAEERLSIVPSLNNSPPEVLASSAGRAPSTKVSPIEHSASSISTDELMRLGAEQG